MIRRFSTITRRTPLFNLQQKLNPVIGTFAGYDLPMNFKYNKTIDVIKGIRNDGIGIFDVSHMGIIELSSNKKNDIKKTLEKIFPVNAENLKINKSALTVLLNDKGYVQDDLIVSNLDNKYRLVVNASNKYNILNLLKYYNDTNIDIKMKNKIILAIQGSNSSKLLEDLTQHNFDNLYFNDNITINSELEIARTGYTGEDGFELYCNIDYGIDLYKKLIDLKKENIYFGGLVERDILRMEAGLCLSGNEFGEKMEVNFSDLNMNFIIGKRRRNTGGFIGFNNINKKSQNRIGLFSDRPLKIGDFIYNNNMIVGKITSSTKSFNLDKFISIGYINVNINDDIYTIKNKKKIDLTITKLPFIKNNFYRKD